MIVMDYIGRGLDPEEIRRQYPYLTLAQIYTALAYYYDHQAKMDAEIAEDLKEADRLSSEIDSLQDMSPLRTKLNVAPSGS